MDRQEIRALYERRQTERVAERDRFKQRGVWLAVARLVSFALSLWFAWLVWEMSVLHWGWVLVPVTAFFAFMTWHAQVRSDISRRERSRDFYARGLDRLDGTWRGRGNQGSSFVDPKHPYSSDLDIFGSGSLFELLATTRSPWGTKRLADWLSGSATPDEVRGRQEAIAELAPMVDLRDALASEHEGLTEAVDARQLSAWAGAPITLDQMAPRWVAAGLGLLALVTATGWALSWWDRLPFLVVVVSSASFAFLFRDRVARVLSGVEEPARQLGVLSAFVARIERERFASERLGALSRTLASDGEPASARIRRLRRLVDTLDARRNQMFAPIAFLVLWGTHFAFALEAWRKSSGDDVPRWLDAVGEIDALLALATYAFEHPEDPFPTIREDGVLFEADGLGHPLIAESDLVRNSVRFGTEPSLLVVSGSNMSGKSTFLRAIGINTVLAFAGAPVRARGLELSPFVVAASIRIVDSLQDGISHFYAEILRLRQVLELASGDAPVLFLLDEILHGTNSHDRAIGAEAVVKGLVDKGAVGLITTHDLALAKMADTMHDVAVNVHFEDQIVDGKIEFDYTMRDGVVTKSNALDLMRSVGLEV